MGLVGWLRSAYLVGFAAFGYRYAFHPWLGVVRQQLAAPNDDVVRFFSATVPTAPPTTRGIIIIEQPHELRSLVVLMGRQVVFLPWYEDGKGLYDRLLVRAGQESKEDVFGKIVPWPHSPQYALDIATG